MDSIQISGDAAWRSLLKQEHSQWERNTSRFDDDVFTMKHDPKFEINPDSKFFCIGSCFARNIEEHLLYSGLDVLSKKIISPLSEWTGRTTGIANKFTSASMLNEVRWAIEPPQFEDPGLYTETGEGWTDLQLAPGVRAVPLERAIERRRYLTTDYFARLKEADVVVMTLGLIEVWYDRRIGAYLNAAPSMWSVRREPDRYWLEVTTPEANVAALEEIQSNLKTLNPGVKIIVTVSPVPMAATFSGVDVVRANTLSKSVLRAAAETFSHKNVDVDYFPSFEIVTQSPRDVAYGADRLHVTDRIVGPVTQFFSDCYMEGRKADYPEFREVPYLAANPDVEERVRAGELRSGYDHWISIGRAEGRPTEPLQPSELMIAAAIV